MVVASFSYKKCLIESRTAIKECRTWYYAIIDFPDAGQVETIHFDTEDQAIANAKQFVDLAIA